MSTPNPSTPSEAAVAAPDAAGKFSISEDWLAVVVGLALLTVALLGLIPAGLIP